MTNFTCPCCGSSSFSQQKILWKELIEDWDLAVSEVEYINKQQGYMCKECGSNLRSMTLAAAIMDIYKYKGLFNKFILENKNIKVLEINKAGNLNGFLKKMDGHRLVEYPEFDMMNTNIKDKTYDLVIHSDTLEHIKSPLKGLIEIRRILKRKGHHCFTTPIVYNRLTKSRKGMRASYHGTPGKNEYLVHSEFGADIWTEIIKAGHTECRMFSIDYPGSVAIIAER